MNITINSHTILKNFFAYAVSAVVLRGLTAITALCALRVLAPEQFGVLALINTFLAIAPIFLNLGLRQAFWLEYFHCSSEQRKHLLNHTIFVYLCIAIPLFALGIYAVEPINRYIFRASANNTLLIVALFYCFIHFFSELFLQILRNQLRATLLASIQIGATLIAIGAYVIMVFYAGWGIIGITIANTLAITIIAAVGLYLYLQDGIYLYATKTNIIPTARSLLALGFPFIPNMLLAWLLAAGNRWMLAYLDTMHNVGIYALADIAGQAFNLCIITPLASAYVPYMLKQYAENAHISAIEHNNMRTMLWAMIGATVLITGATALAIIVAPYLLPPHYQQAVKYVWFIGIANTLLMGTYFTSCIVLFYKKTFLLLAMNALAALTNVALGFVLIPLLHIYGCVLASIGTYALFFYLNWRAHNCVLANTGLQNNDQTTVNNL